MNSLCVGGSFNPIHFAHIRCAIAAMEAKQFERIVLIPAAQPPHKPGVTDLASPADRLAMCKAAVSGDSRFTVDDLELHRTGPSYTIDTARELKRRGWPSVSWLIGADSVLHLPTWHLASELIQEVNFIVVARPGWTLDWMKLPPSFRGLRDHVVEAPLIDISATEIRRRLKAGESIADLTPPSVLTYITEKGLYQ